MVRNAVWLLGLAATLPVACRAQGAKSAAKPAPSDQFPLVKLTGPMRITQNTRIAPGTYRMDVADGAAVIEIDADKRRGRSHRRHDRKQRRKSVGARGYRRLFAGRSHITIHGGAIHGPFGGCSKVDSVAAADIAITGTTWAEAAHRNWISTPKHYG